MLNVTGKFPAQHRGHSGEMQTGWNGGGLFEGLNCLEFLQNHKHFHLSRVSAYASRAIKIP